jgi:hypothetical protein
MLLIEHANMPTKSVSLHGALPCELSLFQDTCQDSFVVFCVLLAVRCDAELH